MPFAVADGQAIDVATLQIDVREAHDGTSADEDLKVAELNIDATPPWLAAGPRPDLVVWGEGSLDPAAAADPGLEGRRRRHRRDRWERPRSSAP